MLPKRIAEEWESSYFAPRPVVRTSHRSRCLPEKTARQLKFVARMVDGKPVFDVADPRKNLSQYQLVARVNRPESEVQVEQPAEGQLKLPL